MWISQCIHLWASSEIHLVPKIFTWYCFLNAAGGTCIPSPIWTLAVSIFSSIHNWYFYCRKNRQYRKIGNSKNENSVFFHQRHAFSTSFNIFVVTYRVTNFLPKLVDMLLFFIFSAEKTEFSFFVFPYFRVLPWAEDPLPEPGPRCRIPDGGWCLKSCRNHCACSLPTLQPGMGCTGRCRMQEEKPKQWMLSVEAWLPA